MIKNNFNGLGTYVSPAVYVVQVNPSRVTCTSPGLGKPNEAGAIISEDENDIYSY